MYVLSNGHDYIGITSDNMPTSVSDISKALTFSEKRKASNYKDNLKATLKRFDWEVIEINNSRTEESTT